MFLDRSEGPDCPYCGCNQATIVRPPQKDEQWWPTGKAKCGHCGRLFSFKELPVPVETVSPPPIITPYEPSLDLREQEGGGRVIQRIVPRVICPECDVPMKVKSTQKSRDGSRTIRYHKCPQCGKTDKTVE